MGYLPLFIDTGGRRCAVIGGDENAEARTRTLLDAGAIVTLIAPAITPGLEKLVARGAIEYRGRSLIPGDLAGCVLAYCTDPDLDAGQRAATEAHAQGVLINVLDRPELCTFIAPATVRRGQLQIAISTSGASPALAKILREELEEQFGESYAELLAILAGARRYLRTHEPDPTRRAELSRQLAKLLRDPVGRADYPRVEALLEQQLGVGLTALGIESVRGAPARSAEPDSS
jgi:precorrin-2 dehydrogenase/sirohydrochlorin ferrochelatase